MEGSSVNAPKARTKKTILNNQESSTNSSKSAPPLKFDSALVGCIRDFITGKHRKREMMDDFPWEIVRKRYKRKWDELRMKEREERGHIEGYQSGDSELDFSEWEETKEERR